MGNRASGEKEDADIEVDTDDDEDWWEDDEPKTRVPEIIEETYAPKPEASKPAPKVAKVDTAAIASLARAKKAKAEPKKAKAEPKEQKAETAAQEPKARTPTPAVEEPTSELPAGEDGAQWDVLEHSVVRQERDVKSSKKGALQVGERCFQTGPWRADPSGRVRMPIRGPRGMFGWVTLDETRCKLATGEFGGRYLELVQEVESVPAQAAPKKGAAKVARKDEVDDLLDMWGDEPASKADDAEEDARIAELVEAYGDDDEDARIAELAAEVERREDRAAEPEQEADEKASNLKAELTETERALRSCKKKIRELEALSAKAKAAGPESLTPAQQEKLGQLQALRAKAKALTRQGAEERGEEVKAAPKRRPRKKAGGGSANAEVAQTSSSSAGPWLAILVVVCGAATAWFFQR